MSTIDNKFVMDTTGSVSSMNYVSKLLWHFVRDRKNADGDVVQHSFQVLEECILLDHGKGLLKRYPNLKSPPPTDKFYVRTIALEPPFSSVNDLSASTKELEKRETTSIPVPEEYLEPRSVCFADIPFNFLPIHMERYSGIGLGFRRKALSDTYEDLKPVNYVPRLSLKSIGHHINEGSKELKAYVKVESIGDASRGMDPEPFEVIYREREWRRPGDVEIDPLVLACIVFRNAQELDKAYSSSKFKPFLDAKVAFMNREDFFEKPGEFGGKG